MFIGTYKQVGGGIHYNIYEKFDLKVRFGSHTNSFKLINTPNI